VRGWPLLDAARIEVTVAQVAHPKNPRSTSADRGEPGSGASTSTRWTMPRRRTRVGRGRVTRLVSLFVSRLVSSLTPGTAATGGTPTAAPHEQSGRISRRWWIGLIAFVTALSVWRGDGIRDSDLFWAIRAGNAMVATRRLPHTDTYSWTAAGWSWVPNSWAWDVVLAVVHRFGGYAAVGAVAGVGVAGLCVLLIVRGRRLNAHPGAIAVVLGLGLGVNAGQLSARPGLVDFLALPLLLPLVRSAVTAPGRRALGAAAAIAGGQLVWVNMHLGALLAVPVLLAAAAAVTGQQLWQDRDQPGRDRAAVGAAGRLLMLTGAVLGPCFATPYGVAAVAKGAIVHADSAGLIAEWSPVGFATPALAAATIIGAVFVLAIAVAWRDGRVEVAAAGVILAVATADAIRFMPLLVVVLAPDLAVGATRWLGRPRVWRRLHRSRELLSCVALSMVAVAGYLAVGSPGTLATQVSSPTLVQLLPAGCRLLNDYEIGGYVELTRPDVPVSVDSRNDVYGRALIVEQDRVLAGKTGATRWVRAHRIGCVLVPTADPIVGLLRREPGWQVIAHDSDRTLLRRMPDPSPRT
jgi:hypothetical protein